MPTEPPKTESPKRNRRWFQFGLSGFRSRIVVCSAIMAAIGGGFAVAPRAIAQMVNPVLDDLQKRGVPFGASFRPLPALTMPDGLNETGQKQAIQSVLTKLTKRQGKQVGYAEFTKSDGPFVLLTDFVEGNSKPMPGHSVDLWFVVEGNLAKITAPTFLRRQFQLDQNDRIDIIKPTELPMGITTAPEKYPGGGEWFAHGEFTLLSQDLRLRVEGTAHTVESVTPESGTMAGLIDKRFTQSAKYPNRWRPILRDENGGIRRDAAKQPLLGPAAPYISAGGYLKVTKLIQPAGALFVEYHLIYDEPKGWFNGKDLLRTKLPIKTEGDVRDFRHQVTEANESPYQPEARRLASWWITDLRD